MYGEAKECGRRLVICGYIYCMDEVKTVKVYESHCLLDL